MAKQTINLGTAPTGVGGDTPRSAFTKTQSNFDELYAADAANYKRSNILGVVSQASGAPTGAIIERGNNANGNYTKFADGTMICTYRFAVIRTMNIATGQLFYGAAEPAKPFPQAFIAQPTISILASLELGECWFATTQLPSTTSWPVGYALTQLSRQAQILYLDYTAIGRWF
jgi:hypothetical protein